MERRETRGLQVGTVKVGAGAPVSVQSMTSTQTTEVVATLAQIRELAEAGCEIVRVAVPDEAAADCLPAILEGSPIPVIADIHFDHRLALMALEAGVAGLRLNPGNIGSEGRIREVVEAARERGVSIRIGVNAGSLEKDILAEIDHTDPDALPKAMVKSALRHIRILEGMEFFDIKVSLKASSIWPTVKAYRLLAKEVDYPFHIGITEAGTKFGGTVKSSVGIGLLLAEGLGDTLRVSLSGDPVEEVRVGWEILKSLNLRQRGVSVVACPTCGRIKIDAAALALTIEQRLGAITEPVTVAVMGCVVNGPGEATEADVGITGGDGVALLYVGGAVVRKVPEEELADAVEQEVLKVVAARQEGREVAKA
ncbi:(E)-4-hydroxy-3-methylbut-2-enyl-diphosphate synthase (flavodoxin) [hydrothermal vent metagenome]|uniref:(E)-4-hydroxy-3-methylbut-2-enyl-diphosphate synthase (Flavodoxin) n=1 Tax=hydrothermal vent metagenome TaxID=652676 RepID=A0A3B0QVZ3_9ZZZZ